MQVRKVSAPVFTALPDGTGVLLNIETLLYFGLNRTGAAIWREIDQTGTAALEDVVHSICERFDVDPGSAKGQIGRYLEELARLRLVELI